MSKTIRIVAAIVDTTHLKMYLQDGTVMEIPQGDPRLPKIVEIAAKQITHQGFADVSIEEPKEEKTPHFADVEKKSNGLIRFFRVAKEKIQHLFTEEVVPTVDPTVIGTVPKLPSITDAVPAAVADKAAQHLTAIAEISQHAVKAEDPTFLHGINKQQKIVEGGQQTPSKDTTAIDTSHTIVAVVDNKVIPNMEKIGNQFERASKRGSVIGVTNFLQRLAKVIDKRSHSVEDVLKFMERADLPIADDGTIIGYKVLNRVSEGSSLNGKFVDCHSGKVGQSIGSYVFMKENLVDHNRNNECSNGLHVARRGYVVSFLGHTIVIIKMNPEDVIAVPTYDANKIRVCGYHIIHELTPDLQDLLRSNRPITEKESGQELLARMLRGEHVGITEHVEIGGHKGTNLMYSKPTAVVKTEPAVKTVEPVTLVPNPPEGAIDLTPTKQVEVALSDDPAKETVPNVDPNAVDAAVLKETALSKKDQARKLYNSLKDAKGTPAAKEHAQALADFKKKAKKAWEVLGITEKEVELVTTTLAKK